MIFTCEAVLDLLLVVLYAGLNSAFNRVFFEEDHRTKIVTRTITLDFIVIVRFYLLCWKVEMSNVARKIGLKTILTLMTVFFSYISFYFLRFF